MIRDDEPFARPTAPPPPPMSAEELAERHAETLKTLRGVEAHHRSEILRLEAELTHLAEALIMAPSDSPRGVYEIKHRIVTDELHRDIARDELEKLKPQLAEAEALVLAAFRRETRPAARLETR